MARSVPGRLGRRCLAGDGPGLVCNRLRRAPELVEGPTHGMPEFGQALGPEDHQGQQHNHREQEPMITQHFSILPTRRNHCGA